VLTGHAGIVKALAALPDGRLATGSVDGTILLWDTRPAASAGASRAVGNVPVEVMGVFIDCVDALLSLPDGRLACSSRGPSGRAVYLLEIPPPAAFE